MKHESFSLDSNLPYTLAIVSYRLPGTDSADFAATRILADVLASQRGDIYALVPAGKALEAQFELAETYPKASVGFAYAVLPAGTAPTSVVTSLTDIVSGYLRTACLAELVDAAKRSEIAQRRVSQQFDSGSRGRLVAGARGRGPQFAGRRRRRDSAGDGRRRQSRRQAVS